jgi:fluoride exporter
MTAPAWVAVALVGGAAAIVRFLLDGVLSERLATRFPIGTFAVNISGSLGLGLLTGLVLTGDALVIVDTAMIGSYTTFSTWMLESQRLTEDAEVAAMALNVALSLAAGVAAVALGRLIGAHL